MKFLVDECTGPGVARWLQAQGHEVLSVYDQMRGASDDDVLDTCLAGAWVLVTNDKDFGGKVLRDSRAHKGVVFLRLDDESTSNKIVVLSGVLLQYGDAVSGLFITVNEKRTRARRP
jgi:predicted nuclease of predicted toxin-antitoxin system